MKTKTLFFAVILGMIALSFSSCSKEDNQPDPLEEYSKDLGGPDSKFFVRKTVVEAGRVGKQFEFTYISSKRRIIKQPVTDRITIIDTLLKTDSQITLELKQLGDETYPLAWSLRDVYTDEYIETGTLRDWFFSISIR